MHKYLRYKVFVLSNCKMKVFKSFIKVFVWKFVHEKTWKTLYHIVQYNTIYSICAHPESLNSLFPVCLKNNVPIPILLYPVVVYTYIQSWASRSKKWMNPPFTLLHLQNNLCSLIHPISTTKINLLLFIHFKILLTVEEQNRESKWQNQSAENEYYIFHIVHFISCNPIIL